MQGHTAGPVQSTLSSAASYQSPSAVGLMIVGAVTGSKLPTRAVRRSSRNRNYLQEYESQQHYGYRLHARSNQAEKLVESRLSLRRTRRVLSRGVFPSAISRRMGKCRTRTTKLVNSYLLIGTDTRIDSPRVRIERVVGNFIIILLRLFILVSIWLPPATGSIAIQPDFAQLFLVESKKA